MRLAPFVASSLLVVVAAGSARSQSASRRDVSVRDGLVHERVNSFFEDHLGFLWIATWEGMSRFDGRECVNFGPRDGPREAPRDNMKSPLVWCVGESPGGRIWAGTHCGGLARLVTTPAGAPAFETVSVAPAFEEDTVFDLCFGPRGDLLVSTPLGVRRCANPDVERPQFDLIWPSPSTSWDPQTITHAGDSAWVVGAFPLVEIRGGEVLVHEAPPGAPVTEAVQSCRRADGSCLVLTTAGLFAFDPAAIAAGRSPWSDLAIELPKNEIFHALAWSDDGTIWVGGVHGVVRVGRDRALRVGAAAGLPDANVRSLALDRTGALWIGTELSGAIQVREGSVRTYLPPTRTEPLVIAKLALVRDVVFATTTYEGLWHVSGDALLPIRDVARPPTSDARIRFNTSPDGDFWLGADDGLWRTRSLDPPAADVDHFVLRGGGRVFAKIHVDREGAAWTGTYDGRLFRVARGATEAEEIEFPGEKNRPPRAFAEDAGGRLWIGTGDQLWRRRDDGRFEIVRIDGVPEPLQPRSFCVERDGTLWVGTRFRGVFALRLVDGPPKVELALSTRDGLPSDFVPALAVGDDGTVWIGTGRGLVRFDRKTKSKRVFGPEDGLAGSTVNDIAIDSRGRLWIGTAGGLSTIDPSAPFPEPEVPVLYVADAIAGDRTFLPAARGATELDGIVVPSERRDLVARFEAADLSSGRALRFEHQLEGQEAAWSAPRPESTVTFAGLVPGRHVLVMRAIAPDGRRSAPARIRFEVAAPFWRRPWFLGGVALCIATAAAALHRARVARALALERVRTQIATDLHDDAGANLAQIAILAEVARRDSKASDERLLVDVAELARATRSSIADLVWAVDPRRDSLLDLVQRVRGVAANLFEAGSTLLEFRAPPSVELGAIELDPSLRRNLLFLLQEALHNSARHSGARNVEVEFELAENRGRLRARVRDDGCGFDPSAATEGNGLASMRRRAQAIGARLDIDAAPGRGSTLTIDVPTGRRPRVRSSRRRGENGGRIA